LFVCSFCSTNHKVHRVRFEHVAGSASEGSAALSGDVLVLRGNFAQLGSSPGDGLIVREVDAKLGISFRRMKVRVAEQLRVREKGARLR
jgi:hypothetical protein